VGGPLSAVKVQRKLEYLKPTPAAVG